MFTAASYTDSLERTQLTSLAMMSRAVFIDSSHRRGQGHPSATQATQRETHGWVGNPYPEDLC